MAPKGLPLGAIVSLVGPQSQWMWCRNGRNKSKLDCKHKRGIQRTLWKTFLSRKVTCERAGFVFKRNVSNVPQTLFLSGQHLKQQFMSCRGTRWFIHSCCDAETLIALEWMHFYVYVCVCVYARLCVCVCSHLRCFHGRVSQSFSSLSPFFFFSSCNTSLHHSFQTPPLLVSQLFDWHSGAYFPQLCLLWFSTHSSIVVSIFRTAQWYIHLPSFTFSTSQGSLFILILILRLRKLVCFQ